MDQPQKVWLMKITLTPILLFVLSFGSKELFYVGISSLYIAAKTYQQRSATKPVKTETILFI